jgi:hypothetical protein
MEPRSYPPFGYPLSALAARATGHAERLARAAGHPEVTPIDLLGGLLQDPDTAARLVLIALDIEPDELRRAILPPRGRYPDELDTSPAVTAVIRAAGRLAHQDGDEVTGTDHLLLALAIRPGDASDALRAAGATPERLREAMARLAEQQQNGEAPLRVVGELHPGGTPASAGMATLVAVAHGLVGSFILVANVSWLDVETWRTDLVRFPSAGVCLWLAAVLLWAPLQRRHSQGWAVGQSVLFGRTAAACAVTAGLALWLSGGGWLGLGLAMLPGGYVAAMLALTICFFRARGWYGVKPHEGWRTMLREGGWALGITALLELGWLVGLVLSIR